MNFDLSDEQQMLQESIDRFIQDNYDLDARQQLVLSEKGYSDTHWQSMAELGWLGVTVPEDFGGFGGNQIDAMVLMEAFGKGLVLEPVYASVILATRAVVIAGSQALKAEILPGVVAGERQLAFAYAEEQARFDLEDVVTRAQADGEDYIINGHKSMVQHGGSASQIVVSARTSGGQTDTKGISLFLIDSDAEGVTITSFPTVDGQQAAEVTLTNVRVTAARMLGNLDDGFAVLESVAIDGILALAAEAVGAMEVLYKDTVAYTQEREQFDHALSDFQVLQHRMVDMFMEYEQSVSMTYMVNMKLTEDAAARTKAAAGAKVQIGKSGRFVGQEAVQLHGGMGMTEELNVGHFFKRLTMIDTQFGNVDHHLKRFAAA